jgi:hypothetical protein
MTCEVAVMNKRGVALAADSAVTLGNGRKIYHTAEKLFSLSPSIPVAVMTFGAADMMNVPWEIVVKIYAERLGSRRFETLDQYAEDFLAFVEGAKTLFPPGDQESHVAGAVRAVWSSLYRDRLAEQVSERPETPDAEQAAALAEIIRRDHEFWVKYDDLEGLGADYGAHVVEAYAGVIDEAEKDVFEGLKLPPEVRADLRRTVVFMYGKEWFHPADESGVVIAGMGESEPFPALVRYRVGTVAAGRLRYAKADEARVSADDDAAVLPFARRETIDMIIAGIHPRTRDKLIDDAGRWMPDGGRKEDGTPAPADATIEARKREFADYLDGEVMQAQPFMQAVAALPRQDLARMAEMLVSLTAFMMRMTVDEQETVTEPIDVALLSKGDGFIWVKHKNLIGSSKA